MRRYDLIVIGGGVSGLWLSYFAALAGKEVVLVERKALGSGGTGRSAGIITTQLSLGIDVDLTKRAITHYLELSRACEASMLFDRRGFVSIEPSWMADVSIDLLRSEGVEYELLTMQEARRLLGDLKIMEHESIVFTVGDGLIDVGMMVEGLRRTIKAMGVEVYEYSPYISGTVDDGVLSCIEIRGGEEIEAVDYVLASGPWNMEIMRRMGLGDLPMTIYTCQALSLEKSGPSLETPVYFADSHLYLRPDGSRRMIAGNGYARVLASPEECPQTADYEFVEEITSRLLSRVGDASSCRVGGRWSGPCSSTPDGLPVLGRLDCAENVFILDGLNGYGLMRAPALAELLVKLIYDGGAEPYSSLFSPSRLKGRSPGDVVVELHS